MPGIDESFSPRSSAYQLRQFRQLFGGRVRFRTTRASRLHFSCFRDSGVMRSGRLVPLILGAVFFVVGLGFFESALIVAPAIVLAWLLFEYQPESSGRILAALLKQWRLWLGVAIPARLQSALRISQHPTPQSNVHPTADALLDFFGDCVVLRIGPSALGTRLPLPATALESGDDNHRRADRDRRDCLGELCATPRAWRAWVFFGVLYLLYLGSSGYIRGGYRG